VVAVSSQEESGGSVRVAAAWAALRSLSSRQASFPLAEARVSRKACASTKF
jgi:hypothetical protein